MLTIPYSHAGYMDVYDGPFLPTEVNLGCEEIDGCSQIPADQSNKDVLKTLDLLDGSMSGGFGGLVQLIFEQTFSEGVLKVDVVPELLGGYQVYAALSSGDGLYYFVGNGLSSDPFSELVIDFSFDSIVLADRGPYFCNQIGYADPACEPGQDGTNYLSTLVWGELAADGGNPVPISGTFSLMACGLIGAMMARRRTKTA